MGEEEKLQVLLKEFQECKDIFSAIGDETRQGIIVALIDAECNPGIRVGEITKKTHLSRPAVSHHLKILKKAGIICMRKIGTMNYYYLDPEKNKLQLVMKLLQHINELV